jgi:hypothetical protein
MILKCLFNVLGKQTLIYVADTQTERKESKDKISLYKIMLVQIRGSLSPWHSTSSSMQTEEQPPIWRVAVNTLNKQSQTGGSPDWGLSEVLTTPHCKNWPCYKTDTCAPGLD